MRRGLGPGRSRSLGHRGKGQDEPRARAGLALESHLAPVSLDHVLDDCQAEAGAALLPRARLVDPVEALEYPLLGLLRYARPVVSDRDLYPVVLQKPALDRGRSTGLAILDRVVDEVRDHL